MGSRLRAALLPAILTGTALAACGSSAGPPSARALVRETFTGRHVVSSGRMSFSLSLLRVRAGAATAPLTVTISGPFARSPGGRPPASDLTMAVSAQGRTGSLSVVSTGGAGYLTTAGASYELPAASVSKLAAGLSPVNSSGRISTLGLDPLRWLVSPVSLGRADIGGTATIHIRAGVDGEALARGLGSVLASTGSLTGSAGSALQTGLAQRRLAASLRGGSVDVFTGVADRTLRRLVLALTLPVSGRLSGLLQDARSARLVIDLQYTQLNRPQRIVAPAGAQPYSRLASALSGGSATTTAPLTGLRANPAWTQCIQAAGQSVAAMQRCAPLLDRRR
jgi:hypothetical protein